MDEVEQHHPDDDAATNDEEAAAANVDNIIRSISRDEDDDEIGDDIPHFRPPIPYNTSTPIRPLQLRRQSSPPTSSIRGIDEPNHLELITRYVELQIRERELIVEKNKMAEDAQAKTLENCGLQKELDDMRQRLHRSDDRQRQIDRLYDELAKAQSTITANSTTIDNLRSDLRSAETDRDRFRDEVDTLRASAELQHHATSMIEMLTMEKNKIAEDAQTKMKDICCLRKELNDAKEQLRESADRQRLIDSLHEQLAKAKEVDYANLTTIDNLRAELIAVAAERDRCREEVETMRVSAEFVQHATRMIEVSHDLLNELIERQFDITNLNFDTDRVKLELKAENNKIAEEAQAIMLANADMRTELDEMHRISEDRQRQIDSLHKQLENANMANSTTIDNLQSELRSILADRDRFRIEIEKLSVEKDKFAADAQTRMVENYDLRTELDDMREQMRTVDHLQEQLAKAKDTYSTTIANLRTELRSVEADRDRFRDEIDIVIEKLTVEKDKFAADAQAQMVENCGLRTELDDMRQQMHRHSDCQRQIDSLQDKLAKAKHCHNVNSNTIDNLRSELLACAEERDRYHDEVVTLRVSAGFIQEAAQTIQALNERLREEEERVDELQEQLDDQMRQSKSRHEHALDDDTIVQQHLVEIDRLRTENDRARKCDLRRIKQLEREIVQLQETIAFAKNAIADRCDPIEDEPLRQLLTKSNAKPPALIGIAAISNRAQPRISNSTPIDTEMLIEAQRRSPSSIMSNVDRMTPIAKVHRS